VLLEELERALMDILRATIVERIIMAGMFLEEVNWVRRIYSIFVNDVWR
jgi:hypothetical protein